MNAPRGDDHMEMYGYVPAGPARERRDPGRRIGLALFVAILAVAAGSVAVTSSAASSFFPSHWDAKVAPIAAEVERLRGLAFEHPVPIQYLAAKDFEKEIGDNGHVSADERATLTREEAVFRALGLIGGKVDLRAALNTSEKSSTLAFYDPSRREIFVRGTTLDVEHRVTVAHELTHVLQDEHFNLPKLQKRAADSTTGDASALQALVEGDAVRIQNDYLSHLTSAEKREYDREDAAEGSRVGKETTTVPDIVELLSSAPYELGPSTIQVLLASGGNAAVDAALTGPTPSTSLFVAPGDLAAPSSVDPPLLPAGAVAQGDAESFGPFETYLTLSMRVDPMVALKAADVVSGGRAVTFRSGNSTCYRVAIAPISAESRPVLLGAVRAWAQGRAKSSVDASGDLVGFTACDPGKTAPVPPSQRFHDAVELLGLRSSLTVEVAKGDVPSDVARCIARVFLEAPGAKALVLEIGNRTPTSAEGDTLRSIVVSSTVECRADASSGLS